MALADTAAIPCSRAVNVTARSNSLLLENINAGDNLAVWLRMNNIAGSTALTDSLSIVTLPALNVAGTTAAIFDNSGWLTSAGDNYVHVTDGSMDELMRLDNLTSGGLIVAFDLYTPAAGATKSQYVFASGRLTGADDIGGFGFQEQANERVTLIYYAPGGTLVSNLQTDALSTEMRHHLLWYLDVANETVYLFQDGDLKGSTLMIDDGGYPQAPGSTFGVAVGGKSKPTPPDTLLEADVRVKNLFIYRSETDISGSITAIAAEMWAHENQLPWELENG